MKIELIGPAGVDNETQEQILEGLRQDIGGVNIQTFAEAFVNGLIQVWKVMGEDLDGVVISEIKMKNKGKEFFVLSISGRGFVQKAAEIIGEFEKIAKSQACTWLTSLVYPWIFKRVEDLGYKEKFVFIVKEL